MLQYWIFFKRNFISPNYSNKLLYLQEKKYRGSEKKTTTHVETDEQKKRSSIN